MTTHTQTASPQSGAAEPYEGNGAQLMCQWLLDAGVEVIFGVPGDTGVALYDAFYATPNLTHVLMNDERGAVFAADAYSRRTNRVGVVEVSSGGGATFCIGGLGEAFAASVPLVVISSDIHVGSRGTGALTETDQMALFAGVTKWRTVVDDAEDIPRALAQAFTEALGGRPGPTAVVIPENILDQQARMQRDSVSDRVPRVRDRASDRSVHAIAKAASNAKRPVILAGGGVHLSGAYSDLEALATALGAPVATSIHGKGAIAETHPLSLGVVGANGGRDYATDWVDSADFALLVGTRANSTDTDGFRAPRRDTGSVTVGIVDIDPHAAATRNYPDAYVATGDAATVLAQLLDALPGRKSDNWALEAELHSLATEWRARVSHRPTRPGLLDPWLVMAQVHSIVPPGTAIVADCGTPTPYLGAMWEVSRAGRTVVTPRGHGPMGYAIPASMGAAFADPGRPVVTFTTDGSLVMAAGALETAGRNKSPITFLHFSNGSLGWIKALQHFYHDSRYFGTQLSAFDAVAVATGFGLHATRVTTLDEVSEAVRQALTSRLPTFIDVPIPDEHDALPPVSSWHQAASGADVTRPVY